jgi:kynureninase
VVIADDGICYLDGNSLGRLPVDAPDRLRELVEEQWGRGLVGSWSHWVEEPSRVGDLLATEILGARPGEVLVTDSTTVNLYKLAAAALDEVLAYDPHRRVVLTDRDNFPTDRYVLEGLCAARGLHLQLLDGDPVHGLPEARLADALTDRVALLSLSHVAYASGARHDLAAINRLAADAGVRVLWDLAHSAGAVPVQLSSTGCELAVGCTYKYLNAGPGAPAFLYVRRELQPRLRSPIWGWFGQRDQFAMGQGYEPAGGLLRFSAGTPPVGGLVLVEAGARLIAEAGVTRLAAKGAALTTLAAKLTDAWLAPLGFEVATPRDPAARGVHLALRHPDAWPICQALLARGVVADFRRPDLLRLGPAPLYTRFVDVWDALDRLSGLVQAGEHRAFPAEPARVT